MRVRVDYFIDDMQDLDYLEIEQKIKKLFSKSADFQHGNLTVYADKNSVGECVDVQVYWKDCEWPYPTRGAISDLHKYIEDLLP